MRMISFLSNLAVLPTSYLLHESRLLGLTLRPSAPVCCCHRLFRARGRLASAQEAVRCPPLFFLHSVLLVVALAWKPKAACEYFLFKRCWNVKVLQLRKIVFGFFRIPCVCTVLDHLFGVRLGALEMCHVLVHWGLRTVVDHDATNFTKTVSLCDVWLCTNAFFFQPFAFSVALIVPWQVGYANGSPSGYQSMTHSRRPM